MYPRRYGKRFVKRRTRRYGRKRNMRVPKSIRTGKIMKFKRTFEEANFVTGSGAMYMGINFTLDKLSNVADFTNLFDAFKVKCIVYRVWAGYDSNDAGGTGAPLLGYLHHVHDYNESNAPTALNQLYEYSNYKCISLNRCQGYKIVLYPKLSNQFYKSVTTTGYGQTRPQWLDCTTTGTGIPHFGLKLAFEYPNGPAKNVRISATAYFACKQYK